MPKAVQETARTPGATTLIFVIPSGFELADVKVRAKILHLFPAAAITTLDPVFNPSPE